MTASEPLILVIDGSEERARNIKELIEFMDAPRVRIADARNWREQIEQRRVAAIFLGDGLSRSAVERVLEEVGELDPNTAIVRVGSDGDFVPPTGEPAP